LGLAYFHGMNPFFPASYSTLEPTALAGLVSEKYGLSHVNCQFLLRGVGDTYLIETSGPVPGRAGRYILRAYRASHRNSAQIRAEVELLLALKRAGVEPGVAHGPGEAGGMGKPGEAVGTSDPGGASGGRWRFDPETTLFGPLANLEAYFSEDPVGYAWLVNDIMTFWQHLVVEATLGRMTRQAADEAFALFLAAYQSCRPVSQQELEAIPYLSLGFLLFYMNFHTTHDQFYPFIQPAHLKLRLGLIQQLMTGNWSLPYPAPRVWKG
jgi:Ser/Thr protein kinase RdoA (MazF antagonist)